MTTQSIPFLKQDFSGPQAPRETRAALVIAHPGHELCLLGWLTEARPHVFILTDGSASGREPKLASTTELLARLNAPAGQIFGHMTDAEVYRAILNADVRIFCELAAELADVFIQQRFAYVVCEAVEGYNPTHDLCRFITEAALARANRVSEHQTVGYEVNLIRRSSSSDDMPREDSIWLRLDDRMLGEKIQTMRAHPHLKDEVSAGIDGMQIPAFQKFPELAAELQRRVEEMGPEAFRIEHLRRMRGASEMADAPFYERYGEILVSSGRYAQAIRYGKHVRPIIDALGQFAETAARSNTNSA